MSGSMMKFMKASKPGLGNGLGGAPVGKRSGRLKAVVMLVVVGLSLTGCVVYPAGGYGYGYGGGYYAAPAYYAPLVALNFGWGGGRWR
jgi:hypothetical protein